MTRLRFCLAASLLLAAAACGDESTTVANNGAANNGAANNGAPLCFEGTPTTHAQLINACTDAVGIDKNPTLPLLEADGTLPPLP